MSKYWCRNCCGLGQFLIVAAIAQLPSVTRSHDIAADTAVRRMAPADSARFIIKNPIVGQERRALLHTRNWLIVEAPVPRMPQANSATDDETDSQEREKEAAVASEFRWQGKVDNAVLDCIAFSPFPNAAGLCTKLESQLAFEIDELVPACGLTPFQQQKLQLAGRGDIARLLEQIDDLRCRIQSHLVHDPEEIRDLWRQFQEFAPLHRKGANGLFGKTSLFAKTLNGQLTAEQVSQFEEWKRTNPASVLRSGDLQISR